MPLAGQLFIRSQPGGCRESYESLTLVVLRVKTSNTTSVDLALDEGILLRIPEYAAKIYYERGQHAVYKRLRISDNNVRNIDLMLHAMDFLTYGVLEPIPRDESACFMTLCELLDLYDLALDHGATELERGIFDHIERCNTIDTSTLIRFAAECYNSTKGH